MRRTRPAVRHADARLAPAPRARPPRAWRRLRAAPAATRRAVWQADGRDDEPRPAWSRRNSACGDRLRRRRVCNLEELVPLVIMEDHRRGLLTNVHRVRVAAAVMADDEVVATWPHGGRALATGRSTYPDVTVVCGKLERAGDDEDAVTNPTSIVEVLSESTESTRSTRTRWAEAEQADDVARESGRSATSCGSGSVPPGFAPTLRETARARRSGEIPSAPSSELAAIGPLAERNPWPTLGARSPDERQAVPDWTDDEVRTGALRLGRTA